MLATRLSAANMDGSESLITTQGESPPLLDTAEDHASQLSAADNESESLLCTAGEPVFFVSFASAVRSNLLVPRSS